jgi:hypothetical protein
MSNYREEQKKNVVKLRDEIFENQGNGIFAGKRRDFVLNDPLLNLWAGIRDDAVDYFKKNNITWWNGDAEKPTGHLLSSQVACLNHLYFLRQRTDLSIAILKNIDGRILKAPIVDNGFVGFEIIGKDNYLNERNHIRGANSTSVETY